MKSFDYYKQTEELIINFLDETDFIDNFKNENMADQINSHLPLLIDAIEADIWFGTQERVSIEEATERLMSNKALAEKAIESHKYLFDKDDDASYNASDIDMWCREEAIKDVCMRTVVNYLRERVPWFNIELH